MQPQGFPPYQPPVAYPQPMQPPMGGYPQQPPQHTPNPYGAPQQQQQGYPQQVPMQAPLGPAQSPRSIYQGLLADPNTLKAGFNASYIKAGNYVCRIDKCKFGAKRSGVQFWVSEMTVVKVINDNAGQGHRQGEAITWYLDRTSNYCGRDLRFFAANIMGVAPEMITDENLDMIFNENPAMYGGRVQPFSGLSTEINATLVPTKSGNVFTKVHFKREVPAGELLKILTPQEQEFFYPNQVLQRMAAVEDQQQAAVTSAPQAPVPQQPSYPQQPAYPPQAPQTGYPQPQPQYPPQGYPQQPMAPR